MKQVKYFKYPLLVSIVFQLFFTSGCKDEEGLVGLDVLPDSEAFDIRRNDIPGLSIATVPVDEKINIEDQTLVFAGYIEDGVYGSTKASFITQLRLTSNINFENRNARPVEDSYLSLTYNDWEGEDSITLKVYEINQDISPVNEYYYGEVNPTDFFTEEDLVGQITIQPSDTSLYPVDTTSASIDTTRYIDIPLSYSFVEKILSADSATTFSTQNFQQYIKGLCVIAEKSNPGSILFINSVATTTNVRLLYDYEVNNFDSLGNIISTSIDTASYFFNINEETGRVTILEHDISGSQVDPALNDENYNGQNSFIAAGGLANLRLDLPENLLDTEYQDVAVNKATLTLKMDSDLVKSSGRTHPPRLTIFYYDEDGEKVYLSDVYSGAIDGLPNMNDYTYSFNISQFAQAILLNQDFKERTKSVYIEPAYLFSTGSGLFNPEYMLAPYKTAFLNEKAPNGGVEFSIIYTLLK